MTAVLVATSAYGAGLVRALGQACFIPLIAGAGAAGIEIRRELFTCDAPDLESLKHGIAAHGLFSVYSAPLELWNEDGSLERGALQQAMAEAERLGARSVKVSLGHYTVSRGLSELGEYLRTAPVPLLVENDQTAHGGRIEALARFLSEAATAGIEVGLTFDVGNWRWTGTDPQQAAERLGQYVRYVHCKGVIDDAGKLKAVPLRDSDAGWRALFARFPQGVPRAIEFPVAGTDLEAQTRRYVDLLASA